MTKKNFLSSILFLFSTIFIMSCQNNNEKKMVNSTNQKSELYTLTENEQTILNNAIQSYLKAFKNKDFEYMIKQLYPPIFQDFQNQNPEYTKDELIKELSNEMLQDIDRMEVKGMIMDTVIFHPNTSIVVDFENTFYTTTQYYTSINYKGKIHNQNKTLIAISYNKGLSWYFADDTDDTRNKLKKILPERAYELLN